MMADGWKQSVIDAVNAEDSVQLDMLLHSIHKQELDSEILSLLKTAVVRRNKNVAEQLLQAGAYVDFPDESGETPLMTCAMTGDTDIASLLLHYGAYVNIINYQEDRQTALNLAAVFGRYEMAALLLKHGADMFNLTEPGEIFIQSLTSKAICWDSGQLMELILDHCRKHDHRLPVKLVKHALRSSTAMHLGRAFAPFTHFVKPWRIF